MPQTILTLQVKTDSANALVVLAQAAASVPVVTATSARGLLPSLQVATDSSNRLLIRIV